MDEILVGRVGNAVAILIPVQSVQFIPPDTGKLLLDALSDILGKKQGQALLDGVYLSCLPSASIENGTIDR